MTDLMLITKRGCTRASFFGLEITCMRPPAYEGEDWCFWGVTDRETGISEQFYEREIAAIVVVDAGRDDEVIQDAQARAQEYLAARQPDLFAEMGV